MKKAIRILSYSVLVIVLLTGCSVTSADLESDDAQDTVVIEESVSTEQPQSAESSTNKVAAAAYQDYAASSGWGVSLVDYEEGLTYTGESVETTLILRGDGDLELGLVLFLDGVLQPHQVDDAPGEEVVMSIHEVTEGSEEETISFMPVTGEAGDVLSLTSLFILNPSFVPEDETLSLNFNLSGSFPYPLSISMEADAVDPIESFAPEVQVESDTRRDDAKDSLQVLLYSEDIAYKSPSKLSAEDGKIDLTVSVAGAQGKDCRVTIFVNGRPVSVEGHADILIHSQLDQTATYTFTLNLEGCGELNTVFAVAIPLDEESIIQNLTEMISDPIILVNE